MSEDIDKPVAELTGLRESWIRALRNRWLFNERLRRQRKKAERIKVKKEKKVEPSGLSGIELLKEMLALISEGKIKELNLEDGSIKIRISFK